jgi:signal transduction histidine kinase
MLETKKSYQEELIDLKKEFEDFVYIVSHDMKSPMRAISNISSWIEDDLGDDISTDVQNNFVLLKNRVTRLENMMNALLELSRVNRFEMESYEVNIPKLVNNCIHLVENKSDAELHVTFNLANENFTTLGEKLKKVIWNILDNAVRFHDKQVKNVYIEINETETDYLIEIRDDGPGIPEDVKDKIFSVFYTVNSKDLVNTVGAGLTISKKIINYVGGNLQYSAGLNNGAVFKFNWPKKITIIK